MLYFCTIIMKFHKQVCSAKRSKVAKIGDGTISILSDMTANFDDVVSLSRISKFLLHFIDFHTLS